MAASKWLARAGALLALLGIFLVIAATSALPAAGQESSFITWAFGLLQRHWEALLASLLMLVLFGLTFVRLAAGRTARPAYLGQILCVLLALICLGWWFYILLKDPDGYALPILLVGVGVLLVGMLASLAGVIGQDGGGVLHLLLPGLSRDRKPHQPAAAINGPHLEVVSGIAPQAFPLDGDNLLMGRGDGCQIKLLELTVSRAHARLRFAEGAWFIQDQGSAAGIVVNDEKVSAVRLNPGDKIALGNVTLVYWA